MERLVKLFEYAIEALNGGAFWNPTTKTGAELKDFVDAINEPESIEPAENNGARFWTERVYLKFEKKEITQLCFEVDSFKFKVSIYCFFYQLKKYMQTLSISTYLLKSEPDENKEESAAFKMLKSIPDAKDVARPLYSTVIFSPSTGRAVATNGAFLVSMPYALPDPGKESYTLHPKTKARANENISLQCLKSVVCMNGAQETISFNIKAVLSYLKMFSVSGIESFVFKGVNRIFYVDTMVKALSFLKARKEIYITLYCYGHKAHFFSESGMHAIIVANTIEAHQMDIYKAVECVEVGGPTSCTCNDTYEEEKAPAVQKYDIGTRFDRGHVCGTVVHFDAVGAKYHVLERSASGDECTALYSEVCLSDIIATASKDFARYHELKAREKEAEEFARIESARMGKNDLSFWEDMAPFVSSKATEKQREYIKAELLKPVCIGRKTTLFELIKSGEYNRKNFFTEYYSSKKVNGEYKLLSRPKTTYCVCCDGFYLDIPAKLYDLLRLPTKQEYEALKAESPAVVAAVVDPEPMVEAETVALPDTMAPALVAAVVVRMVPRWDAAPIPGSTTVAPSGCSFTVWGSHYCRAG